MPAVRHVQIGGGSVPAIEVQPAESLQRIQTRVAKACNVQPAFVKVSVDGRRAKDLTQVPGPDQVVTAAVRSSVDQDHVVLDEQEVAIPPIPVIMKQEMEGLNVVVAFDEVIDNSIRAGAKHVAFKLQTDGGGLVTGLECQDDGAGMAYTSAINHMRLAHTDSGIVTAPREYGRPLAPGLFFNKNLSRHGKGAAALLYFGDRVETTTKTQDAAETVVVALSYKDWTQEFAENNTCSFKVRVTRMYDFTVDDESYTHIFIQDLKERIDTQLANPAKRQQWAREIAYHYWFFVNGFPEQLWDTLPADLHPTDELLARIAAAGGRLGEAVRPAGGVSIDVFGIKLSREQGLPRQVQPGIGLLLDSYIELMGEFGQQNGQPKLMPFWLPIRWTEPGMAVEQVPDESMVKVGSVGSNGPAGMLRGVHRDFLLLLLYFPYKDGKRTKPRMIGDAGVEDVLHTAWCGRVIPKACQPILPPLVAEARESREDSACAWMLTDTRLCGVLFCSPEVYTSNHKTELLDDAVSAVFKRLGARQGRGDSSDDLWCWDTRRNQWCGSPAASKLLLEHHKLHWAPLEQQGELLETYVDGAGVVCGKAFKPPGKSAIIKAGDLVQMLTWEDRPDDISTETGGSRGRRGGGAASGGRVANSSEPQWPMGYRLVEHFEQNRGDGARYQAALREWTPSWAASPGQTTRLAPSLVKPVPAAQAQKLMQSWTQSAPRYLAWWDPTNKKPSERIEQLPGITSLPVLTVGQVPDSLAVCFVNSGRVLGPEFKRESQWSSNVTLDKLAIRWQFFEGTIKPGGRIAYSNRSMVAEQTVKYTQANKCAIRNGLTFLVDGRPGHYCLRVKSGCDWVEGELEYRFHVGGHEARTLEASWSADSASLGRVPRVRLTEEMPVLELRAKDSSGKVVSLPFRTDAEVKAALTVSVKSEDDKTMLLHQRPPVFFLAEDKQLITVKGLRLAAQKLENQGTTTKQAYVSVELVLPDSNEPLVLADDGAPAVQVLSGAPQQLVAAYDDFWQPKDNPCTRADASRGSTLFRQQAGKILLLDAYGNKLDVLNEEYCARVRFHPPLAAEAPNVGGRSADLQAGTATKRRKSGMAVAADDAVAAAAAAAKGYEAKVDGNVVDLPSGFRWSAPPGAGPVGIIIDVFSGRSLPQAADAQPLLTRTGWYRMQRMHAVAMEHDALDFDDQHAHRWLVWKGKESFKWSEGVAFVLNTVDFGATIAKKDRHVPQNQAAAVPEEVLNRFCESFEPRQDVLAGQLVNTFITPSGKKICSQATADRLLVKGKVPYFLASEWNSLLDQRLVYEVVFMVTADLQQTLDGVMLQLCNESDHHDEDFRGRAKLCLLNADSASSDGRYTQLHSANIAGGQLWLPSLKIEPGWFTAQNRGTATVVLLDDEPFAASDPAALLALVAPGPSSAQQWQWASQPQKELGRIHLRLAPAAEELLVMAAGPLFQGVCVDLPQVQQTSAKASKGQPGTFRLLEQVTGSSGAAGSSRQAATAAQGAWAAWKCAPAQDRGDSAVRFIDPRDVSLQGKLRLQLGQPITLHFVAVDYMGCPAVLSKQQRQKLWRSGLQLQRAADAPMMVNVEHWNWGDTKRYSATATDVDCSGHLGGPFVNSCTFTVSRGCGEATLSLRLEGRFGRETLLEVPVLLEAGPVAADGLRLLTAQVQRHSVVGTTEFTCSQGGLISLSSWEPLQTPAEAEVRVKQEPGLEQDAQPAPPQQQQQGRGGRQSRRQQQPDLQQVQGGDDPDNPIDLCDSDEDDDDEDDAGTADMVVDEPAAPQHFEARQQWLASLGVQQPAVQYTLQQPQPEDDPQAVQLVEGSSVRLQLQLFDSHGHEVAAEKPGRLLLRHLQNWREVQQQQAVPRWQDLHTTPVSSGSAEVTLQLGVGDALVGEQLFLVQPTGPQGSELAAALPVLLKVEVAPGPFPGDLVAVNVSPDLAAAGCSSCCVVTAAEALQELYGGSLQEQELQALLPLLLGLDNVSGQEDVTVHQSSSSNQGAPAVMQEQGVRVLARDGSVLPPLSLLPLQVQLETWLAPGSGSGNAEGSWVPAQPYGLNSSGPVTVPPLPDNHGAQGGADKDAEQQQQQQVVRFKLPLSCRQLPQAAGWYRLTVSYDTGLPSSQGPLQLQVGPVLLLPGTPHRLLRVPDPQQEAAGGRGRPVSGKRKRSAAAAGAGAGVNQAAAAAPADQFVVLDQLNQVQNMQQVLQLLDVWGNACQPAAAKLAARLPASVVAELEPSPAQSQQQQEEEEAQLNTVWTPEQMTTLLQLMRGDLLGQPPVTSTGQQSPQPAKRQRTTRSRQQAGAAPDAAAAAADGGGDGAQHEWQLQVFLEVPGSASAATSSRAAAAAAAAAGEEGRAVRLITTLPFDADGCCTVPAMNLQQQLGITTVGEYRLVAKAAPASGEAAAGSSSGSGGLPAGSQMVLLLGSWHVVSESTRVLTQRQVTVRAAQKALSQRVSTAKVGVRQQEASLPIAQARHRTASAAAKAARNALQTGEGTLSRPPPVQLQQAAAAAAQQQLLLAGLGVGNRGRQQALLEHPWMRHAGRQAQQQHLAARPCTASEVQTLVPNPMLQLHHQQSAVLGPIITLGSVELPSVAVVLSAYLRNELQQLVCLAESVKEQVYQALTRRQDFYALDLGSLLKYYQPPTHEQLPPNCAWYLQHPQQLLPPNAFVRNLLSGVLDWSRYQDDEGFLGFACNLIHLNTGLLGLRFHVPGQIDGQGRLKYQRNGRVTMDLRRTLWQWKLGNVLVFESERNIEAFRRRLQARNRTEDGVKLIALDGYTFNVRPGSLNHRLQLDNVTHCLGAAGLDAAANPLDLRLRCIKERQHQVEEAREAYVQAQAAEQQAQQEARECEERLRRAKQDEAAAEADRQRLAAQHEQELAEIAEQLRQRQQA